MWIPDDSIPEVTIDIAYDLPDRWSTDMPDMKRFPDICTDIVDDDGFKSSFWKELSRRFGAWLRIFLCIFCFLDCRASVCFARNDDTVK